LSQLLRLRYATRAHRPAGLFEHDPGHCLILAANHQTYVDLGLLMIALGYHGFQALVPIRTLGTQDFRSPVLQRLKPLIKLIYKLEGVIELTPEKHDDKSLPEKLRGMLVALHHGEVVAIFPEGEIWRSGNHPSENSHQVLSISTESQARKSYRLCLNERAKMAASPLRGPVWPTGFLPHSR
jgi:hypothetical protein